MRYRYSDPDMVARLREDARKHREAARRLRLALRAETDVVRRLRMRASIYERVRLAKTCDDRIFAARVDDCEVQS